MKDEIEIFLSSPNAFCGGYSTKDSAIAALNFGSAGVRINGKQELPAGPIIGWGIEIATRNRYYYGSSNGTMRTRRDIEGFVVKGQEVQFKITNVTNYKTPGYRQYYNSDVGAFAQLIQRDQRTMAFLENIPGLEDKFKKFVNDTAQWWVHTEESVAQWSEARNGNPPINFLTPQFSSLSNDLVEVSDLLSKEVMGNLENQLCAVLEIGADENEGLSEYTLEVPTKIGIENGRDFCFMYETRTRPDGQNSMPRIGPLEDINLIPTNDKALKLHSWKSDDQNKPTSLKTNYYSAHRVKHSDYTVNFQVAPGNNYKIYAHFGWKKAKYTHQKTVRKRRRTNYNGQRQTVMDRTTESRTIYLPFIDAFYLEILPEEGSVNPHYTLPTNDLGVISSGFGLSLNEESGYSLTRIERVRDATKKRASKGGYKGGYQGIEQLRAGTTTLFEFITKSNFSDIAGGPAIRSYPSPREDRVVPLTLEQYLEIERPDVDVKPVEVGHLNLLRLSDPPKRLIVGETLSDLLLPSMPALIIAVDTDLKVTSGQLYTGGELCSGDCNKSETVDVNLPPGLYLVERKLKCALGHDPGRAEYTAGFGDSCNEIITIRNLLSQLDIAYDEFRGNMVGTSNSNKFATAKTDSGGLLDRLG